MWQLWVRKLFALLVLVYLYSAEEGAEVAVGLDGGGSSPSFNQVPSPLVETSAYYEELLERFGNAFNSHAVDDLASMLCEDAVFRQSSGGEDAIAGGEIWGREAIRKAFRETFVSFPSAQWVARGPSFVSRGGGGDWRGVSEWTFIGNRAVDRLQFHVNGVDIFTFRDGLIATKDAYRKDIPPKKTI